MAASESPEASGEDWDRPPAETEPTDALQILVSDFSHDPDALAANAFGVLGRAANLAPLSYRTGLDNDSIMGEPAQALALRVLRGAHDPGTIPEEAGKAGFEALFTYMHAAIGRRTKPQDFRAYLGTIVELKGKGGAGGLSIQERRRLVVFDVRLRHAAGRLFRRYCEDFDQPPPASHVHPLLYGDYFMDASFDALPGVEPLGSDTVIEP